MGDTVSDGAPGAEHRADQGVSDSTRKCSACGERFSGVFHSPCPADGKTLKYPDDPTVKEPDPPPAPSAPRRESPEVVPPEVARHAADPGRHLQHYILVQRIGRGGMGEVWKAWDQKLTRWIAIKFLLAGDHEDVERFQREARLAARLRHPNIAAIFEVGEAPPGRPGDRPRHFLAMDLIEGETLACARLSLPQVLEVLLKVARAVHEAHNKGIIHRDLKPANIMVAPDLTPYVMDFGCAKAIDVDSSISVTGTIMGTPAYMPPEQAKGKVSEIDARSDVYSLGATLYYMLAGQPPFAGDSMYELLHKVCEEPPVPPRSLKPEVPEAVEAIVLKAMAKEKSGRHATAALFADDLARVLEGRLPEAPSTPITPPSAPVPTSHAFPLAPAGPPRSRSGWVPVMLVLLLATSGVIAAWQLHWIEGPVFLRSARAPGSTSEPAGPAEPSREKPMAKEKPPEPGPRPEVPPSLPPDPGVFSLQVAVHPFAEIVGLRCDGEAVKLEVAATPLLKSGLKIGDYEIFLRHPQHGEKTVRIPRTMIKPGKTYVVWGRMDDPALGVAESP